MSSNVNTMVEKANVLSNWEPSHVNEQSKNSLAESSVNALAFETFLKRGIPNRKDEEYKYSDTTALFEKEMLLGDGSSSGKEISFTPISEDVYRIVSINGIYQQALSTVPAGIEIGNLTEAELKHSALIKNALGKIAAVNEDPFVALNTLQFSGGLFVRVPKGVVVDKAIELIQVF